MLVVMTTVPDAAAGRTLAEKIVQAGLAACVQILPAMTSVYVWEGEVKRESEHLILVKTDESRFAELEAFISSNHSYDVPEIVALGSQEVSEPYLAWVKATTQPRAA